METLLSDQYRQQSGDRASAPRGGPRRWRAHALSLLLRPGYGYGWYATRNSSLTAEQSRRLRTTSLNATRIKRSYRIARTRVGRMYFEFASVRFQNRIFHGTWNLDVCGTDAKVFLYLFMFEVSYVFAFRLRRIVWETLSLDSYFLDFDYRS